MRQLSWSVAELGCEGARRQCAKGGYLLLSHALHWAGALNAGLSTANCYSFLPPWQRLLVDGPFLLPVIWFPVLLGVLLGRGCRFRLNA